MVLISRVFSFLMLIIFFGKTLTFHIPGFIGDVPLRVYLDRIRLPECGRKLQGAARKNCIEPNTLASECSEEVYFTQKVDHFDSSNNETWNQLVQINSIYFNENVTDRPIIFLVIGGESPAWDQWICYEGYTHMRSAIENQALIIQLEHRFFGKSWPIKNGTIADMSVESLKYLSPQQALEDLANFIRNFKYKNLDWKNSRWIIFGGSYPGSLCAWSRAMYPDLTVGGICSSAPILPKMNFYEYTNVMEFAILNATASKYQNCRDAITSGFSKLRQLLYTADGQRNLNAKFNITPPLDPSTSKNFDLDATNFLSEAFGYFRTIVQQNVNDIELVDGYNILSLCKEFWTSFDPVKTIRNVYFKMASLGSGIPIETLDNDYGKFLANIQRASLDFSDPSSQNIATKRGWLWLLCGTGLGWLQTTDNNAMFYRAVPFSFLLQICSDVFGNEIDANYISKKVAEMKNQFSAPWNFPASNVVLTNGDYDPWHALGCLKSDESRHQIARITHGASHCSDMYSPLDGEADGLNETREIIFKEINYYISLPPKSGAFPVNFVTPIVILFWFLFI